MGWTGVVVAPGLSSCEHADLERDEEARPESGGGYGLTVRVLIVDDQEPFRMAARMVVEATDGFEVVAEVETGEAAVEAAEEIDPDLVLMDVNLPGINGLEATRRILAGTRRVVILVLSTYEEAEYAPRAAESGAAGYIPKSAFGPDRLAEAWEAATKG
jgi:DNA-binding NarL/FixJ family response regulator